MNSTHKAFAVAAIFFGLALLAGCAHIVDFDVSPRTICPDEQVFATWDVGAGQTKLEAKAPLEGLGVKPQQGRQSFSLASSTTFTLKTVAPFHSEQREMDVTVLAASSMSRFGEIAHCEADTAAPTVSFVVSDKDVSRASRALVVRNPYTRPITVQKDGIEVTLAPKMETDHFKDISMIGAWTIRAAVGQGETCSAALHDVGERLIFRTQLGCAGR